MDEIIDGSDSTNQLSKDGPYNSKVAEPTKSSKSGEDANIDYNLYSDLALQDYARNNKSSTPFKTDNEITEPEVIKDKPKSFISSLATAIAAVAAGIIVFFFVGMFLWTTSFFSNSPGPGPYSSLNGFGFLIALILGIWVMRAIVRKGNK